PVEEVALVQAAEPERARGQQRYRRDRPERERHGHASERKPARLGVAAQQSRGGDRKRGEADDADGEPEIGEAPRRPLEDVQGAVAAGEDVIRAERGRVADGAEGEREEAARTEAQPR